MLQPHVKQFALSTNSVIYTSLYLVPTLQVTNWNKSHITLTVEKYQSAYKDKLNFSSNVPTKIFQTLVLVERELDRLESEGVLEKTHYSEYPWYAEIWQK